ncbi:MAG: hypothetical protein QOE08_373 [Thermoleophilaceae bacterium]|jgi:uncharacterized membrane protein YczE|nr:hypothetical protein [Thermoleophilaceae bacterium]
MSRWRPTPSRLVQVLAGLWIFGTGEGLVVASELGNSPWTVFADGLSKHTPLSIGAATIVIGAGVLLAWLPIGERPGLGTVLNVIVIGVAIDATLALVPDLHALGVRVAALFGGIALVGVGSGFYLTAELGPGPRDGLMTGLSARFGKPIALVRTCIEVTAVAIGIALGGRAGLGSVAFAVLVGPAVAAALWVAGRRGPLVRPASEP